MKFPYDLSEQRLSLLSEEDRRIYEYEHSPFYDYNDKAESIYKFQNNIPQNYDLQSGEFLDDNGEVVTQAELDEFLNEMIDEELIEEFVPQIDQMIQEALTEKEYYQFSKFIKDNQKGLLESIKKPDFAKALNEGADGRDMTYWANSFIPGFSNLFSFSWVTKLVGAGLAIVLVPIIAAISAGKSKLALKLLERYMNKIVETIDDGVYKKRKWWDVFRKSKLKADQSRGSFRQIQETVERDFALNTITMGKMCGLLGDDAIKEAISGNHTGGIAEIKSKILDPINEMFE